MPPKQPRHDPSSPSAGSRSASRVRGGKADFERVFETAPVGLCVTDRRHRFLRINERLAAMNGSPMAEHIGRSVREMIPHLASTIEPLYGYVLETGKPLLGIEIRGDDPAHPGAQGCWLAHFQPYLDADGKVAGVSTAVEEITERKRAEESLRRRDEYFGRFTEQTPIGFFRVDPLGRYTYVNRSWQETTGFRSEDVIGKGWNTPLHPDDYPRMWEEYQGMLAEGRQSHSTQYRIARPDGRIVWVLAHWTLESDDDGQPLGSIGSIVDISDYKRSETALQQNTERLDAVVAERTAALEESYRRLRKSERLAALGTFAAGIAHQINNPVGSILVAAQFALGPQATPSQVQTALRDIVNEAKRCGDIVSSLLRFAREEPTEKHPGDVNAPVRNAASALKVYAREQGVDIRLALAPDLPPVMLNATTLGQAVMNLLQNAVQAGGRTVTAKTRSDDPGFVTIQVQDDGPGVEPNDRVRLFDPFFTTRHEEGGSGLGLSITHGIIADHGGSVEVSTETESGTRFVIRLPSSEE